MARKQRTTSFRIQYQDTGGAWVTLFNADFPNAVDFVNKAKRQNPTRRFRMEGENAGRNVQPRKRNDYRAVR